MSGNFIANVLNNCVINFDSSECANGIDTNCVLKLTTDCFDRMNAKILSTEMIGGGGAYDAIIPHLLSRKISKVTRSTKIPIGIMRTLNDDPKLKEYAFSKMIQLGIGLKSSQIADINSILKRRPKDY
jgi:hypothetical protein